MKLSLSDPPTFFVKVKGPQGFKELRAVLATGATLCLIRRSDAQELGYPALYQPWMPVEAEGSPAVTNGFIIDAPLITLEEVSLGTISRKKLRAMAFELPEQGGVDFIVGTNFLEGMKVTFDDKQKTLLIEPT
ncbi:MAG: retropepsin-like domain-containing protein [Thaumarchaeota archaeon]|nr:retropepsin-like domain-containing protein [Nitrososphaerota archaeon]